jgi:hypothetical protein
MRMEFGSLFYELTIDRVLYFPLNGNGDGFIHFVAADYPCFGFANFSFFSHCLAFSCRAGFIRPSVMDIFRIIIPG